MFTLEEFVELHAAAGVPEPTVVELQSGATLFVVSRAS
jgi:hypothetical protein